MLNETLKAHGRALAMAGAMAAWTAASLLGFLLADRDSVIVAITVALGLVVWNLPGARPFRRAFVIVVVGLWGGLVTLEATIRLSRVGVDGLVHAARYNFEPPPMRGLDGPEPYHAAPGYVGYSDGKPLRINQLGYRGADFAPAHPGVVRLMSLGSSITFAPGVAEDATYTSVAARALAARLGRPVEGLDMGMLAYGSTQILQLAETMSATYTPDVVVLEVRGDDQLLAHAPTGFMRAEDSPPSIVRRASFAALALGVIPAHVHAVVDRIEARLRPAAPAADSAPPAGAVSPARAFDDAVVALAQRLGARGAQLVILLVRPMAEFASQRPDTQTTQRLQAVLGRSPAQLGRHLPDVRAQRAAGRLHHPARRRPSERGRARTLRGRRGRRDCVRPRRSAAVATGSGPWPRSDDRRRAGLVFFGPGRRFLL